MKILLSFVLLSWATYGYNILSLDGGGIRGAFGCAILMNMENYTYERANEIGIDYLTTKYKEDKKVPMAEIFDMIAGTSTGSIMAGGLAAP